jgi:hypothetical protein
LRRVSHREPRKLPVDIIFILVIVTLYVVTHWLAVAISRLGGHE